jgi:hypothetical protein
MLIQGQVGAPALAGSLGPGTTPPIRQGQQGDVIVSELHGRYYEANRNGTMFMLSLTGATVASANISPVNGTNTSPLATIFNPIGSGKNISIVRVTQTTTSGTPGGPLVWNVLAVPQTITNTVFTLPWNMSTLLQQGSIAKTWLGQAIGSSTVLGTVFRSAGGPTAVAATGAIMSYQEEHAGNFIIPQGQAVSLCATAAGTTHIVSVVVEWEEVPV